MGQGQTKASKRREANGEQAPSPKKEAKKSSKKSRSSRSSSVESPSKGQGHIQIEERQASPTRGQGRESRSPDKGRPHSEGVEIGTKNVVNSGDSSRKLVESPPKPKRTYEVEFIEPEKENVPGDSMDGLNISEIRSGSINSSQRTPVKMSGVNDSIEPLTPVHINNGLNSKPQATSTPAPNGIITSRQTSAYSDDDHTDVSDDEAYSSEQQFHFPSPTASNVSLKSYSTTNSSSLRTRSDSSYEKKAKVNYGKFYNTSYLKKAGSQTYLSKGRTQSEPKQNTAQFIRPANFSYSKETPDFLKAKKGGMMQLAQGKTVVKTTHRSSSPAGGIRNTEAYKMSQFPGGKRPLAKEIAKIDSDDWPAPPSLAAILPEIMRQRRKSRGEADSDDDDEDKVFEDPKIKREIEELSKFKDESGIGTVICRELDKHKIIVRKALDPWKASRVPNAAYEPQYGTRYQSPMFASPSRFLDTRRRAWDDSDIYGYRTMSTMAHFTAPKQDYDVQLHAATMPAPGMYGGPLDYNFYHLELSDRAQQDHRISNSSVNTETSKVTSTIFDQPGVSLMTFQKSSWHTEIKPTEYDYERLKISNFNLPKDVDRNQLEIHLPKEEFESIFDMTTEEFRHLPEWKRNDIKRKKDLY